MRCDLCRRRSQPDDRGWVSILVHLAGDEKPMVFTYCPDCTEHELDDHGDTSRGESE